MARRLALITGNDDYHDPTLARLTAPQADISAFAGVLQDPRLGAFDDVQILHNRPNADVRRAIARFFHDRQRDDLLLLYFSGHGVLDEEGQLYLATPDTERDLLDATAITAHYVNRLMRRCRSRRQVLILDCCHSGAFTRSAKGGGVGTEVGIGETFAGDGTGHVVLAASKATEYAFEGDEVTGEAQPSIFTRALVEGIRTGDADLDRDGYITPEELYDYAYRRVRQVSPHQTPGKWVYEQTGELILARSPRRRLPATIQAQLAETDPLIRFRAVDELAALVRGDDEALARLARQTLENLEASDDSFTVRRAAAMALQTAVPSPSPPAVSPTPPPAASEAAPPETTAASHRVDAHPRAVRRRDVGAVALAWFLAGVGVLGLAYLTKYGEVFLLAAALALVLGSAYTFQRVLQWAGEPPSEPGIQLVAGLLGLVPLAGPAGYAALLLRELTSWQALRPVQRLAVVMYAVVIAATHAYLLWLFRVFWEAEAWWEFQQEHIVLNLAFFVHGMALFLGALLLARTITPRPARRSRAPDDRGL